MMDQTYQSQRERLIQSGLYSPADEHDACGVGLIAAIDGKKRRDVVQLAIQSLKAVWHRGAVDADGKTGDGAGLRLDIPQTFFKQQVERTGHIAPQSDIGVGMVFLPRRNLTAQEQARTLVEAEIIRYGFTLYGWRRTPINPDVLGKKASDVRPEIEQIMFSDPQGRNPQELERILYLARRKIEKNAKAEALPDFYICSLSVKDIVYKGMFLAEAIDQFYPDLQDPQFESRFAIFHQRYSTNTFPEWKLAQPFRMLAHNGEINTLKANTAWMKSHEILMASKAFGDEAEAVKPVIQPGSSDSAALDQTYELLVRAGRSGPMVKTLLIPEAWSKRTKIIPSKWRALFEYCTAVMEPWDGPAALAAFDGRWALAGLDRNGLRPLRYSLTHDGLLTIGSEVGMTPLPEENVIEHGSLDPGRMMAVDLEKGKLYRPNEILDVLSSNHPYEDWLSNIREIDEDITPGPEPRLFDPEDRRRRQFTAALSREEIDIVLTPMAATGKEAIGSMGDDSPLAVLSTRYRPLSHYFRQNFSQVTNPPIDPIRESGVMSLKTRFKNLGNILVEDETQTDVLILDSPILSNGMSQRLEALFGNTASTIDCTMELDDLIGNGTGLGMALEAIKIRAAEAVRDGAQHLILTDEFQASDKVAIPMILVIGAVHTHLTEAGLRTFCSLNVRAGECVDAHACAVFIGLGATTINPYMAFESVMDLQRNALDGLSPKDRARHLKIALDAGLLKIMSKMGISMISSYRAGCNFEVVGLSRALAKDYLGGVTSRISGMGLAGLETRAIEIHLAAWAEASPQLPSGGFYRQRASGERHAFQAPDISALQHGVRENDYASYKVFESSLNSGEPIQLRDLLDVNPLGDPQRLDLIESVNSIRRRFVTPGMSLGALSPEAHGTLNVAMNRIGAKSVSGEGGEDPARYTPLPSGDNMNSAIKQVASGRFGVTAEYLNQCREIEIKIAQGAKPGEGGQLPGHKNTPFIASMRFTTPGTTLISPPPHHDIYSIEDLAQLIYDLKHINPDARIAVKLVSSQGVGAIAAGVAKAKADIILISGNVGGTGASPQTSIKFAGAPLELGLAEAHQVLSLNNLRERVTLRADGGIRTGRDIVIAAMLGAEEFGIGTTSLVSIGCLMVRQCHSNTCPVGICTQDEALRERFTGSPDHVVNLMTFIARDVREWLAKLGASSLEDIIGRADLLEQVSRGSPWLDDLDLNALFVRIDPSGVPRRSTREQYNAFEPSLDETILKDATPLFERGEKMQLEYDVHNTNRAVGTLVSSKITRRFKQDLPEGQLSLRLNGSCGQSLAAFGAKGVEIDLTGNANDYVGKGLSGSRIVIRPHENHRTRTFKDAIIGNTCLYGATSGELFAAGRAGQRFAIRNSGATAVIEGCGSCGCEYMTGGTVMILGSVGDNFAAGMTGGRAFVLDDADRFQHLLNPDNAELKSPTSDDLDNARSLLERHVALTKSLHGQSLLDNWDYTAQQLLMVVPREIEPT